MNTLDVHRNILTQIKVQNPHAMIAEDICYNVYFFEIFALGRCENEFNVAAINFADPVNGCQCNWIYPLVLWFN